MSTRSDITKLPDADLRRRELLQILGVTALASAAWPLSAHEITVEKNRLRSFALNNVRLLNGQFKTAQELDAKYLLSLDPDRLLHNFHINAGLPTKAPVYGGWESQEPWVEIRCHGHTLGHYLSACAMMFAATDDQRFKQRTNYIVSELRRCQQTSGGMTVAFPDGQLPLTNSLQAKAFAGVPWYTTHKVMSGLRDAYLFANTEGALTALRDMANWIIEQSKDTTEEQFQLMLRTEHGGMNEVLADLFVLTHNSKYLELAQRFNHRALLDPLSKQIDVLDKLHSNTQIPKVIGFQRQHELTNEKSLGEAAQFFWRTVVTQRSFATGGNGDGEHFFPVSEFAHHLQSAKTMETCCTHNMLRLTRALFLNQSNAVYMDYYELALFNSILASQDPDSGMMTYFQPTRPGYLKLYCTPTDSFWCCTGTGMENHAKYGDSIYFHDEYSLYVNLFIASQLNWPERNVVITQKTEFPDQANSTLTINTRKASRFGIKIRHPAWCELMTVTVNGEAAIKSTLPGYFEVNRKWRDGDVIKIEMPMKPRLQYLPTSTDIAAVMMGPIVLAGRFGKEGIEPGSDIIVNERTYGDMLNIAMKIPTVVMDNAGLEQHLQRTSKDKLVFKIKPQQPDRELELIPYYRIAHERYSLYWNFN